MEREQRELIPDEDLLYRRIPFSWYVKEENRIKSAAFKDPEASVDWEKYITPEGSLANYPSYSLVALKARIPRACDQAVIHDPETDNYSHSLISGRKSLCTQRQ